jgi:uncharacterized protein YcfJ
MPLIRDRALLLALLAAGLLGLAAPEPATAQRFNPYADPEEALPPLAADGTIQWGAFYKSASIQQNYERLWSLGACRGTNRAITEPVKRNKLLIDRLPEADYDGVVVGAVGTLAGGMVAFQEPGTGAGAQPLVAQLHPAGVTQLKVVGRVPATVLRPGLIVRLVTEVDEKGRGSEPITALEVVTPPAGYQPDPVRADTRGAMVGTVRSIHGEVLTLQVNVGRIRRLTLAVDPQAIVTLDAARLDLVSPGDKVALRGRIWSGEGAMGAGTVFASEITVSKPPLPGEVAALGGGAAADRP